MFLYQKDKTDKLDYQFTNFEIDLLVPDTQTAGQC